ncbi:sodium:dicarboxylate symporter [Fictibacillus macauensis ZFHKF-1]|uniref:L-cystine uptake protein TcyP n=1 Tax=Fictibacillus macauensis ZFHKF-1 TaxID=1196324 RepID=I8UHT4_9BACL|nr:L-cystine transporter [Fictibacillus macauensis]EIT86393.1 sodium:dicarboxylate symporter [Fictibacillus macauensis ZFHKF-1]
MTTIWTIVNVIILLLLAGGLYWLKKKGWSFAKRVFLAMILGLIFGFSLQYVYDSTSAVTTSSNDWFSLMGGGYVRLLQMVVIPLVFVSILSAFTKIKETKDVGKLGGTVLAFLLMTTAIAAAVGIAAALSFHLDADSIVKGKAEMARASQLQMSYAEVKDKTLPAQILDLLPANPFLDFTGARPTSTIAVVIFASLLGIAYLGIRRKQGPEVAYFEKGVTVLHELVMKLVQLVLRLTPYGILALMTKTAAVSDLNAIAKLGTFVIASYVALLFMFILHLLFITFSGLSPLTYIKKAIPVLSFAFTSRTSAGALPLNVSTQKKLGVPEVTANFAGSFGLTIGQNGCAGIYPAMLAVMIAPTVGINPLTPSFILALLAVVVISSFGVAGVGGGATFAAILVLSSLNLPIALAGLLISVEPLIDMGRTALNVSGSMTAGILSSKVRNELDEQVYNEPLGDL